MTNLKSQRPRLPLPSSTLPWPFPDTSPFGFKQNLTSLLRRAGTRVIMTTVAVIGGFWVRRLNRCEIHNREPWLKLVEYRDDRPLLSISNHSSCLDDVFIHGLLPFRVKCRPRLMRWTLAADDICFRRPSHALFFSMGQTAPVVRGNGVYQKSVDAMIDVLDSNGYVHVYPEGGINMTHEWTRLKWGVARMISDSRVPPILVPVWHVGFEDILPNYPPYVPRVGKRTTVLFGAPIDTECWMEEIRRMGEEQRRFEDSLFTRDEKIKIMKMYSLDSLSCAEYSRKRICDFVEEKLKELKMEALNLHDGRSS